MFWNIEQRTKRKRERLQAKVTRLEGELSALREQWRILMEENQFCGETLARMRLHARADLAEAQSRLIKLGITPTEEGSDSDKRRS